MGRTHHAFVLAHDTTILEPRMLLVLPFVTLAAMAAVAARRWGWREGLLLAFVGLLLLWWATAELLSSFAAFSCGWIAGSYVVVLIAVLLLLIRGRPSRPDLRAWLGSPWVWVLLVELGALALLAATVAPNNFDSMAYYLPKVEHWLQRGRVGPFKTAYAPQVYLPPLAEVGMAHMSELGRVVWAVDLTQSAHIARAGPADGDRVCERTVAGPEQSATHQRCVRQ